MNAWALRSTLVGVAAIQVASAQVRYVVTGTGHDFTPIAIGQNATMTGPDSTGAVAWDPINGIARIPGFAYNFADAEDVNAIGQVVGWSDRYINGQSYRSAYIWDRINGMQLIDLGIGGVEAYGVNDFGLVTGRYFDTDLEPHAFLWRPDNTWITLPPLFPGGYADGWVINNSGEVFGYATPGPHQAADAVLWHPDLTIEDIGNVQGGVDNFIARLNNLGFVCGSADGPVGNVGYIREPGGTYTVIRNPINPNYYLEADGLNDLNQVVGTTFSGVSGQYVGFIWTAQRGSVILNTVLDSSAAGWYIRQAQDINNAGQIAGYGSFNGGAMQGVMLTPVRPVSGTVNLQNYSASPAGVQVTVEIRAPGTTTDLDTPIATLDAGGSFTIKTTLQPGTYDVAVKASHWLKQNLSSRILSDSGLTGLSYSLVNGDVNGDNAVSLSDFAQLRSAFGSSTGSSNWNANADLNGDGSVGLGDFAILRSNYGRAGDP